MASHWCLVISFKNKTICFYDSMGVSSQTCLKEMEHYLRRESLDKRKTPLILSDWSVGWAPDVPLQKNCDDWRRERRVSSPRTYHTSRNRWPTRSSPRGCCSTYCLEQSGEATRGGWTERGLERLSFPWQGLLYVLGRFCSGPSLRGAGPGGLSTHKSCALKHCPNKDMSFPPFWFPTNRGLEVCVALFLFVPCLSTLWDAIWDQLGKRVVSSTIFGFSIG